MTQQLQSIPAVLTVTQLPVEFPDGSQHLDLTIKPGEIVAVLGKTGAGKTYLVNRLTGLTETPPNTELAGKNLTELSSKQRAKHRLEHLSFLPATPLFFSKYLTDAVRESALIAKQSPSNFLETALSRLQLKHLGNIPVKKLTPAELKLVACAGASAKKASLLVALDPTAGLSDIDTTNVLTLFRALAQIQETAVLFTTSDPVVAAHAHRVILLTAEKIAETPAPFTADSLREAVYSPANYLHIEDGLPWLPRENSQPSQVDHSEQVDLNSLNQFWHESAPPAAEPRPEETVIPLEETLEENPNAPLPGETLEETLQRLAPPRELDADTAQLLTQAQRILQSLPGTVAPRGDWDINDSSKAERHV